MRRRLGTLVVGCALLGLAPVDSAAACGGLECGPDQFVPRSGGVPANLPGVAWWFGDTWVRDDSDGGQGHSVETTPADLRFECKAKDGTTRSVAFASEEVSRRLRYLRPNAPLQAGERCTIESTVVDCDLQDADLLITGPDFNRAYLSGRAEFAVAEPAALPTTLGTLSVQPALIEQLELAEGSGCSALYYVCAVRARLNWSSDAEPWQRALVLTTEVDGKPWSLPRFANVPIEQGASYLGRGHDVFIAPVANAPRTLEGWGLSNGRHSVVIRAVVPGSDIQLATDPVEIDLSCGRFPSDGGVATDAGARPDAGVARDAGDSGASDSDAAAPSGVGSARGQRLQARASNSGCAVPGEPRRVAWPVLAAFVACLGLWRRRRAFTPSRT